MSCHDRMSLCHVIISCHDCMSLSHVIISCHYLKSLCHVIMSCHDRMLLMVVSPSEAYSMNTQQNSEEQASDNMCWRQVTHFQLATSIFTTSRIGYLVMERDIQVYEWTFCTGKKTWRLDIKTRVWTELHSLEVLWNVGISYRLVLLAGHAASLKRRPMLAAVWMSLEVMVRI